MHSEYSHSGYIVNGDHTNDCPTPAQIDWVAAALNVGFPCHHFSWLNGRCVPQNLQVESLQESEEEAIGAKMRIAVVSDIHANWTAFDAVLADVRDSSPDIVFHGGDLADGGSSPVEIVDCIRDLGWAGVIGNTDEMLSMPDTFEEFASKSPQLEHLWAAIREMALWTREALGEERLAWLRALPPVQVQSPMALVHASPETSWRSPMPGATDLELQSVYRALGQPVAVYGHIHLPYIRTVSGQVIANSGSVGLPHDGDRRASYLLIDDGRPEIRRVEYAVDREISALRGCGLPRADWVVKILESASPRMP